MLKGTLFILSGPSGVGKGTLKERLLSEFCKHLAFSVSATTRKAREGEADGREYFFVDRQEFERRIREGGFLEHAEYAGNLYGTPRAFVERLLSEGKDVILEIEVKGARQVMRAMPENVSIFVLPPSDEILAERLRGRGTEDEATVQRRLSQSRAEIESAGEYDYRIVNGGRDKAYEELKEIYLKHAGFMRRGEQEETPCP